MKKIGIVTMFYKTINYGGMLQAYALFRKLKNIGFSAEQISYKWEHGMLGKSTKAKKRKISVFFKRGIRRIRIDVQKIIFKNRYISAGKELEERKKAFGKFASDNIDSSKAIYNSKNIKDTNQEYDAFVTGSDQVWSAYSIDEGYSLNFAEKDKIKVAYAASGIGGELKPELEKAFSEILPTFDAVSVREKNACDLLKPLYKKDVCHVCDPVLLLSAQEWDEVCAPRIVEEKYVFCYFLGEDKKFRKLATEFAKKKGFNLVHIPYLKGRYCSADEIFGKSAFVNASPGDFISLIKNAEYVFTDSFHVSVFSTIYHKQFFVFKRSDTGGIERILNITRLADAEHHLLCKKSELKIEHLTALPPISFEETDEKVEKFRKYSVEFLKNALND